MAIRIRMGSTQFLFLASASGGTSHHITLHHITSHRLTCVCPSLPLAAPARLPIPPFQYLCALHTPLQAQAIELDDDAGAKPKEQAKMPAQRQTVRNQVYQSDADAQRFRFYVLCWPGVKGCAHVFMHPASCTHAGYASGACSSDQCERLGPA